MTKFILDSQLIKMRFEQAQDSYHKQACVQKQIATSLLAQLQEYATHFNTILEVGCGTGFLTKLIEQKLSYTNLILNDLYISKYLDTNYNLFLQGDISTLKLPTELDLIISSSTVQWLNNPAQFFKSCAQSLNTQGILCFSSFLPDNFCELKQILKATPNYQSIEQLQALLAPLFKDISFNTQTITLSFKNPLEILRHIKATGVNAIYTQSLTKTQLLQFCKSIEQATKAHNGQEQALEYNLSYKIVYIIAKKAKGNLHAR